MLAAFAIDGLREGHVAVVVVIEADEGGNEIVHLKGDSAEIYIAEAGCSGRWRLSPEQAATDEIAIGEAARGLRKLIAELLARSDDRGVGQLRNQHGVGGETFAGVNDVVQNSSGAIPIPEAGL